MTFNKIKFLRPEIRQKVSLFLGSRFNVPGVNFSSLLVVMSQESLKFGETHVGFILKNSCGEVSQLMQFERWNLSSFA